MMTKWHKGPPPSIGWWPASYMRDEKIIRWWDGELWSRGLRSDANANQAARWAYFKESNQHEIEWTDRWWL